MKMAARKSSRVDHKMSYGAEVKQSSRLHMHENNFLVILFCSSFFYYDFVLNT